MHTMSQTNFANLVINWQQTHGRTNLPWQQHITPYRVWVSEVMLQQTTVATVSRYFDPFLSRFPDISTLACSDLQDVLSLWAGLGYYRRARYLHQGARYLHEHCNDELPNGYDEMIKIPGIGPSTAGAILSLGFGQYGVILDGNVKRVLCRYGGIPTPVNENGTMKQLWDIAKQVAPQRSGFRHYSQGMMDIGATVCHKQSPQCEVCPLNQSCFACINEQQDSIPARSSKKKNIKKMDLPLILITDGVSRMLKKQPSDALWADMWMPPICQHPLHKKYKSLPTFVHKLTHYDIHVFPYFIKVDDESLQDCGKWVPIDDTGVPKPKIVEKCLSKLKKRLPKLSS